jgi:hypothetical protein
MSSFWDRLFKRDQKPEVRGETTRPSAPRAYVLPWRWKGQDTSVISLMPESTEHDIAPAIVGSLVRSIAEGGTVSPENFVPNSEFVAFMHEVIQRRGCELGALQASARQQGNGFTYILDGRTPDPEGYVPAEDIIGGFEVQSGNLIFESYRPNPNHVLFSGRGLFQLGNELLDFLFEELEQFVSMFNKVSARLPAFPTTSLPIVVARIQLPGKPLQDIITAAAVDIFKQGMAPEVVFGSLNKLTNLEDSADNLEAGFGPENFAANPAFKTFLYASIAKHVPDLPEYQRQAQVLQNGWLYLIDGRAGDSVEFVGPQDVIGAFFVRNGAMKSNWYRPNSRHRLYTSAGFFQLSETLTSKIVADLVALNETNTASPGSEIRN